MRKLMAIPAMLAILVTVLAAAPPGACGDWQFWGRTEKGSGDLVTEERDVGDFTRIKSAGAFDVYVRIGKETRLTVTFDDNLIEYIRTRVRGHTLRIDSEGSYSSRDNCRIEITVPELEEVTSSGSGSVEVEGLRAEEFSFTLTGSGDLRAEGSVKELDLKVSGSGDIDARDLEAEEAHVRVSGSGKVWVHARESLDSRVSGSGDVYYYGDPEHVSEHVSGSGKIKKKR